MGRWSSPSRPRGCIAVTGARVRPSTSPSTPIDGMKERIAASACRVGVAVWGVECRGGRCGPVVVEGNGGLPPSWGTECWDTRGSSTNSSTTEEEPYAAATVRRYRPAPPPIGDRAGRRARRAALDGADRERRGGLGRRGGQSGRASRGGPGGDLRVVLGGGRAQEAGARVHLAHPSGLNWGQRRRKDDERDATDLVGMLRLGRLPEAWIAPPATRELRELVRYRAKLVALRSGLKAQVHAVMAKEGVLPAVTDMFCQAGNVQLNEMQLGDAYTIRVESLRDLIEAYDREVAMLETNIRERLRGDPGYRAIQAINGIGRTMAAILVAEIGDVTRFRSAAALCSWAGLTPRHRESDTKVVRGRITKGSRLVRWAA